LDLALLQENDEHNDSFDVRKFCCFFYFKARNQSLNDFVSQNLFIL